MHNGGSNFYPKQSIVIDEREKLGVASLAQALATGWMIYRVEDIADTSMKKIHLYKEPQAWPQPEEVLSNE